MIDARPSEVASRIAEALHAVEAVEEAYLFGSVARGEAGPTSDVDVAVFLESGIPAAERSSVVASLAATLMSALGTSDVDVVALNDAPPLLYHRVLRDGHRLLSRDLPSTTRREGQALSRYCDWLPQLAKIEAAHRRRIEAGSFGE